MPTLICSLAISFVPFALVLLSSCGSREHTDRTITTMRWSSGSESRTVEVRGSVEFTDDDRDVKSISPGGFVSFEDGNWLGPRRSYIVRADSSGSPSRTYEIAGRPHAIDADAQAWIAHVVRSSVRESGAGASQRIERFLATGGPAAVLREVSQIHSDGSKRIYLQELVESARLSDDELRDVMRSARTIGSDGDKTALLIDLASNYFRSNARESWFRTLSGVGSDRDKRRGLEHVIRSTAETDTLAMAAKLAGDIGSDDDKAGVLSSVLARGGHDPATLAEILRAAETIGSDGDKARVLAQAARCDMRSEAVQRAFLAAARTVGSDGDRKTVLTALLRTPTPDSSIVILVSESAKGIGSDGEKAIVLRQITQFEINDAETRSAFFTAVNSIGSDGDRTEVLSNVLKNPAVVPETAVAAIDCAMRIGSDGNKASLLMLAAERHGSSRVVRASLENALRSVHSDGDYRRVAEALWR